MMFTSLGVTADMIAALIVHDDANKPRTLQRDPGPSEIGTTCDRQLGHLILNTPEVAGSGGDPLPRWVGTAGHSSLERILEGNDEWETEFVVTFPGYPITGHVDAYHIPTGTVLDFKFLGVSTLRKYKTLGPPQQYRTQAHMYGTGMALTGRDVANVAIAYIPRSGLTSGIHVWSEPYDEAVTEAALQRYEAVKLIATHIGPGELATADAPCDWCNWYKPGSTDLRAGCPGVTDSPAAGFAAPN